MDKSITSHKVYSILAVIILVTGILFQAQILYHSTYPQYIFGKEYKYDVEAGESKNITISASTQSGKNVSILLEQIKGGKVDVKSSNSNKSNMISFAVNPYPEEVVFKVTGKTGKITSTDNLIFLVQGDTPPVAKAGDDKVIKIAEVCNSQGQNTTGSTPPTTSIILDGRNSTDDKLKSLKYEWTQIAGEPKIELTSPTNATTSFQKGSICDISNQMNAIFTLKVTDSKNQTDDDNVMVTIIPETTLSLNYTFG